MNCQEFWKTTPQVRNQHPHLQECASCATRVRIETRLSAGMRAVAEDMARLEAPGRVEARLLTAFRRHSGSPSPVRAGRPWFPAVAWAAALAAMIAAGVFVVRSREPEAQRPTPRRVELAMLDTSVSGLDAAMEEGFLPLPGAAHLANAEDVDVLHVELPRSAMMQVGIEVSPDRAGETVRADVMVGADGMARAVRFVDAGGSD